MKKSRLIGALAAACAFTTVGVAFAADQTVKVTPNNEAAVFDYPRDIRPGGSYAFADGPDTPPIPRGSLHLSTLTGSSKVQLLTTQQAGTELSAIDALGYASYRKTESETTDARSLPALNMVIDFNGPEETGGFATLIYEPVYNGLGASAPEGTWQTWDAFNGGQARWWSTRAFGDVCAGAIAACMPTWQEIVESAPNGTVTAYGVNQGSGQGGLESAVDALTIGTAEGDTTYNFEPLTGPPASKDECKNGGWQSFDNPTFKNQGDCVSYVASQKA